MARAESGIGAYLRISSRSQSSEMQRAAIERTAAARGDTVAQWFAEKQSGARLDRGELSNVREAARAGRLRTLYVYRLDRLTRSGIRDTLTVLQELRGHGCRVVTVADGFALDDGPTGEVVIAVMAWAAQMEREAIAERIRAARARVEARGGAWGRPRRVTESVARKILAMRRQQTLHARPMSVRAIASALKVPKSTVALVLSEKGAYAPTSPSSKRRRGAGASE